MSLTTLRRSRPETLLCTTIRRCTFSRMTKFGPRSSWMAATADKRNLPAIRRLDRRAADRVERRRIVQGIANDQRKRDLTLQDLADRMSDPRRLQRFARPCPIRGPAGRRPPHRRALSASECRSAPRSARSTTPATCDISPCTWLASCRSVGRSSPKILTAMLARVPDSMWSMRCEIGCPIVTFVPGSSDTFCRSSSSTASRGRSFISRRTSISADSTPCTCSSSSARPVRRAVEVDLGNARAAAARAHCPGRSSRRGSCPGW